MQHIDKTTPSMIVALGMSMAIAVSVKRPACAELESVTLWQAQGALCADSA
jgi:hypothetical protein